MTWEGRPHSYGWPLIGFGRLGPITPFSSANALPTRIPMAGEDEDGEVALEHADPKVYQRALYQVVT